MQNLTENQMDLITGGAGDSLAKDLGQFVGGSVGWVRANFGLYLLLGPGIGSLAAGLAGGSEANR